MNKLLKKVVVLLVASLFATGVFAEHASQATHTKVAAAHTKTVKAKKKSPCHYKKKCYKNKKGKKVCKKMKVCKKK